MQSFWKKALDTSLGLVYSVGGTNPKFHHWPAGCDSTQAGILFVQVCTIIRTPPSGPNWARAWVSPTASDDAAAGAAGLLGSASKHKAPARAVVRCRQREPITRSRSIAKGFSKPLPADAASCFRDLGRSAYSRLRCRGERYFTYGSTIHRLRSRGELNSTVPRSCTCRGERRFTYGSTVRVRVETESKSMTIIRDAHILCQ